MRYAVPRGVDEDHTALIVVRAVADSTHYNVPPLVVYFASDTNP